MSTASSTARVPIAAAEIAIETAVAAVVAALARAVVVETTSVAVLRLVATTVHLVMANQNQQRAMEAPVSIVQVVGIIKFTVTVARVATAALRAKRIATMHNKAQDHVARVADQMLNATTTAIVRATTTIIITIGIVQRDRLRAQPLQRPNPHCGARSLLPLKN